MNKQFCPKCKTIVSNDFGHTLAFWTNCGAAINGLTTDETIELKKNAVENIKSKSHLFTGLILGVVLTVDRDTPEIKAILNEIIYIQSELKWNAESQTSAETK